MHTDESIASIVVTVRGATYRVFAPGYAECEETTYTIPPMPRFVRRNKRGQWVTLDGCALGQVYFQALETAWQIMEKPNG